MPPDEMYRPPPPVVPIRDYIDARLEDLEKRVFERFDLEAGNRAILSGLMEKHLDQLNGYHAEMMAERRIIVPRAEHEPWWNRISALEEWQNRLMGVGMVLVASAAIMGALVAKFWK